MCAWCSFSTIYKGNMKRHLISCHNCNDELLRKYAFELERLRKSAPQRAGPESLPFIEPKAPQPPGTRRPRNPPTSKSIGRPKKSAAESGGGGSKSKSGVAAAADAEQTSQQQSQMLPPPSQQLTLPPLHQTEYVLEAPTGHYGMLHAPPHAQMPPPMMLDYGGMPLPPPPPPPPPMQFVSPAGHQLLPPPTASPATYIIKDCANDSGLGVDEFAEVAALHQSQALPGY